MHVRISLDLVSRALQLEIQNLRHHSMANEVRVGWHWQEVFLAFFTCAFSFLA